MLTRIKRKLKFIKRNTHHTTLFHLKRNKKKTPSQELSETIAQMDLPTEKLTGDQFAKLNDEK